MPLCTPSSECQRLATSDETAQQGDSLLSTTADPSAIAPLLHTKSLTGKQATKAAIVWQRPQASIIHLATHGLVDTDNGFGSAITLAPDRPGTPNDADSPPKRS